MRLVGTVIGENKKIAVFAAPDGRVFKYEENEAITDTTILLDIFDDVVIVQDEENNKFEVYMNNTIKSSEG
jgi:ABC-type enterochelin transport system ATPase subunit